MFELDLVEPDLELLRQEHGHRRIDALSHLDLAHDQDHAPVHADADERIRRKRRRWGRRGGRGHARPRLDVQPQEQTAAGGGARGARNEELPTRHAAHGQPCFSTVDGVCAARLIAARIRGYVPQRQMFPDSAWSISVSLGEGILASKAAAAMTWPD